MGRGSAVWRERLRRHDGQGCRSQLTGLVFPTKQGHPSPWSQEPGARRLSEVILGRWSRM